MENVAQIETVKQKIITAITAAIRALHLFIFEKEGDRRNRQRLRNFKGFDFKEGAQEHVSKLEYVRQLTFGDLISCNIFSLEYDGNKKEIINRICHGLMDLNTLTCTNSESDESDENEEEHEELDENQENEKRFSERGN
ncbi:hypothetical protein EAI_12616 [Harpegnathos saltator]|uniref:Uncharacterized protein n=1 Tax=Harpegnathos saltator TaxID=610380 RepID=E2BNQ2_HARSA|nr:hypothetical protein EAI_12616 [Harpegnathos saltator]